MRQKTRALIFVPSPRLRGEGDMALLCGQLGEGDHPHAPDLLKVPLTQPAIAGPSLLPSPRLRGEGAITTAAVF